MTKRTHVSQFSGFWLRWFVASLRLPESPWHVAISNVSNPAFSIQVFSSWGVKRYLSGSPSLAGYTPEVSSVRCSGLKRIACPAFNRLLILPYLLMTPMTYKPSSRRTRLSSLRAFSLAFFSIKYDKNREPARSFALARSKGDMGDEDREF